MKYFLLFFIATIFLLACHSPDPSDEIKRPNIILIMADDVGYSDISPYGGEIKTPNLERLAEKGLRFSQFYNTARCCPTRASLLSGLHPHQAGVGHMMNDRGNTAYQGDLNDQCLTIAEVLRESDYATYMAGKWHVTPYRDDDAHPDKKNWPLQRGFSRFFGTIHGAGSFFDPNSLTSGNDFISPSEGFYYTDAISDTAVHYIKSHPDDDPFFMYVAYTAAHWPMHALPQDIAKYDGRYDQGWEAIRAERYQRMLDMGLIKEEWAMSDEYPYDNPWEKVELKDWHAACMEVYAAMLDNMDQGIGRIIGALEENGKLENTLIFYLQDNGACAESYGFGRTGNDTIRVDPDTLKPMAPGQLQTLMEPLQTRDGRPVRVGYGVYPGPEDTYIGYDKNWANASNTPFRMFKHWAHEGGIATPLIVHWPQGIAEKGAFRWQPGQLPDIMATCVDVSGANYPKIFQGNSIKPMEGVSLVPAFANQNLDREALYWEHEGNRAIRKGKWKLVSDAWFYPQMLDTVDVLPLENWELYDLEADRTETKNLAKVHPELVTEMAQEWHSWAEKVGAIPKPPVKRKMPGWVVDRIASVGGKL